MPLRTCLGMSMPAASHAWSTVEPFATWVATPFTNTSMLSCGSWSAAPVANGTTPGLPLVLHPSAQAVLLCRSRRVEPRASRCILARR